MSGGTAAAGGGDRAARPELAYVINGYPRRSELFIASEVHRLEQGGIPLRLFAIKPGDPGEPHPVVRRIAAPVDYLPAWTPVPGISTGQWLARNLPAFAPAIARCARRHPAGLAAAAAFSADQAVRIRRLGGTAPGLTQLKELLLATALADRLSTAPGVRHIHAASAHRPASVVWMASMITGLPFSFTGHAKDIYVDALQPAGLLGRKLRAASFAVTCTHANRSHLLALAPGARVHTIYHGLNADFASLVAGEGAVGPLGSANGALHIVSAGRHVAKKGFDLVIEACSLLAGGGVDVRFRLFGGPGEETDRLRRLIAARGIDQRVDLAGPCTQAQLLEELRRADVFCLPCRQLANGDRDGIPNVIVEAMAAGTPVVTTPVSGIPEVVADGVSGVLVPADDPAALAGALKSLHQDPALRRRLGASGRMTVAERFNGDREIAGLLTLFRGALA